jgi:Arc/MetJ-type ribon-helix-helix transcriptional regulator
MKSKLALSLDAGVVSQVDALVRKGQYPSRSAAVEAALRSYLRQGKEQRYDAMLDLLQADDEQALADERFQADLP